MSNVGISIIGAGSSYTPELIEGILKTDAHQLPIGVLRLHDVDQERLQIMARLTQRMIKAADRPIVVQSSTSLDAALGGADFVITQIRVGGMRARHLDETIPLKYGVVGQETTGPGGMFKALRTIPMMLDIARAVERCCPNAFILNYTNPSGIITEALRNHSGAKIIGLCAGIPAIQDKLKQALATKYPDVRTYCVGLNHLNFIHRITSDGKDVTQSAIDFLADRDQREQIDNGASGPFRLAQKIGAIPIGYARYFFERSKMFEKARSATETRAQAVQRIEHDVLAEASRESTCSKPEALKRRGGDGYASITFSWMAAILQNTNEELVGNVPSEQCVPGIDSNQVSELVCRVNASGATPLPTGPIPMAYRGIVQAVKAYETLTIEAAVKRCRKTALQALLNHPLTGDLANCEPMLDEMLAAHDLAFR
jgi:6-phospho-beta-glucosidase